MRSEGQKQGQRESGREERIWLLKLVLTCAVSRSQPSTLSSVYAVVSLSLV